MARDSAKTLDPLPRIRVRRPSANGSGSTPAASAAGVTAAEITPALAALAALLLLTASFGRGFSKIEIGASWLHPTELVLALMAIAVLLRARTSDWILRLRRTRALVPLAVFWVLGAIAALRGLADWGFSLILHDIGLVEYSILVPLLAATITSRAQFVFLCKILALGGLLASAVYAATLWTPVGWGLVDKLGLIMFASGIYIGLFVLWPLARKASGVSVARWEYAAGAFGVMLIVLGAARANWVAVVASMLIVCVLALPGLRVSTVATAAAFLAIGVALSLPAERVEFGQVDAETTVAESQVGPIGDAMGPDTAATGPQTDSVSAVDELTASFGSSYQNTNMRWRLAYWKYAVTEGVKAPLTGVGFGTPANFDWNGTVYDSRLGDPEDPFDVTNPHNSFIDVFYRMGIPGFIAIGAILWFAFTGVLRMIRAAKSETRALGLWLLGALVITSLVASLTVALEGPFMGIFFWVVVGLALLAPQMLAPGGNGAKSDAGVTRAASAG